MTIHALRTYRAPVAVFIWLAGAGLATAADGQCAKADFEAVVEQAATALRDLNLKNRPLFQEKLRELRTKRKWSTDQFLKNAAPFVKDDRIAEFDQTSDDLLAAIASMGQEGANAATPDCGMLVDLRSRMTRLVATQTEKWNYMFEKIATEMAK